MSLTTSAHWMYSSGAAFYDYEIEQASRWQGNYLSANYFRRDLSINRQKWTCSFWMKRSDDNRSNRIMESLDNNAASGNYMGFLLQSDGKFHVFDYSSGYRIRLTTAASFRDVGAWYNFVLRFDSTQSTASNRVRLYVNGVYVPFVDYTTYPSQNLSGQFGNGTSHWWGRYPFNQNSAIHGYMADVILADGQSYGPEEFGELKSGIWVPKDPSITYGTGGFRVDFSNASAMGTDVSGNGNNWTAYNWSTYDQVLDTPTNNFATLNTLNNQSGMGVYEGNLRATTDAAWRTITSTYVVNNGKWYWEYRAFNDCYTGMADNEYFGTTTANLALEFGWRASSGQLYYRNSVLATYSSYTTGDIISYAYDADTGKVWIAKNGTWQNSGNPAAGTGNVATLDTSYAWTPAISGFNSGAEINFGQDSTFQGNTTAGGNADDNGYGDFKYAPPSGFLAMCSANLPQGAINTLNDETPEDYFNTILWTGDGTNPRTLTGVGFEPSFSWLKSRSQTFGHRLYDQIRGGGRVLSTINTNAEYGPDNGGDITAWTADGFTTSGSVNNNNVNGNGYTFAAWNWKANGSGVSNTDGSIASTVSVGATSQQNWFSVVGYTGTGANATVGHGLGVAPDMYIVKNRDQTGDWCVYHKDMNSTPEDFYMLLNLTNSPIDNATIWNDTAPTSTTFSIGSYLYGNNIKYIAYCFANAEGLCKVSSYTGNGSTNGVFVYTGFRPAFVMVKRYNTGGDSWAIFDNKRSDSSGFNQIDKEISVNETSSEYDRSAANMDFVSNGFKMRNTDGWHNASGGTYIYLAIAEQPFKYANAR